MSQAKIVKRCFQSLKNFKTFEERFDYLKLEGIVGARSFGFDRYINQGFYKSREWIQARNEVILRDRGRDLGIDGYEIKIRLLIHHMNPITLEDLESGNPEIINPEFLITTTHRTHQAIHYGDSNLLHKLPVKRFLGDTNLW